ncbi:hypothetical protein PSPO01_15309 [Paraphaeosphaeria sporulosa]
MLPHAPANPLSSLQTEKHPRLLLGASLRPTADSLQVPDYTSRAVADVRLEATHDAAAEDAARPTRSKKLIALTCTQRFRAAPHTTIFALPCISALTPQCACPHTAAGHCPSEKSTRRSRVSLLVPQCKEEEEK